MQSPHLQHFMNTKEIGSTAGEHAGMRATRKAAIGAWSWLSVLVLVFLASIVYVAFGGALDPSLGTEPETLHFAATAEPTGAGSAAHEKKASNSSDASTDYFPAGYVNRGRDGDGNVMTYEHD